MTTKNKTTKKKKYIYTKEGNRGGKNKTKKHYKKMKSDDHEKNLKIPKKRKKAIGERWSLGQNRLGGEERKNLKKTGKIKMKKKKKKTNKQKKNNCKKPNKTKNKKKKKKKHPT